MTKHGVSRIEMSLKMSTYTARRLTPDKKLSQAHLEDFVLRGAEYRSKVLSRYVQVRANQRIRIKKHLKYIRNITLRFEFILK